LAVKSKEVTDAIEASKGTLYRAAAQVDSMKKQLLTSNQLREENNKKLHASEVQINILRSALSDALQRVERGRMERERMGSNFRSQHTNPNPNPSPSTSPNSIKPQKRDVYSNLNPSPKLNPNPNSRSSNDKSSLDDDRIKFLLIELERVSQQRLGLDLGLRLGLGL
jgi:hypothetical protein